MLNDYFTSVYSQETNELIIENFLGEKVLIIGGFSADWYKELSEEEQTDFAFVKNKEELGDIMKNDARYRQIINPTEKVWCDNLYKVSIGYPYPFMIHLVFAYDEGDALERLTGFLTDKGDSCYLSKKQELLDSDYSEDEIDNQFIYVDCSSYCEKRDNYVYYIESSSLTIEKK